MLVIFGGIFALTGQNPSVMKYGSWICSWAPTISLILLFKKFFPDITIKDFYKRAFSQKINTRLVLIIALIYILLITVITFTVSIYSNAPFTSMWDLSASTLLSGIFTTAISGPMGEESGWRGFLLPVFWKKAGVIKGALLLSAVWAPWHVPLWFIPGYTGIRLLEYIALF
jgi:membrane protease YdiL (CAAX protease family)